MKMLRKINDCESLKFRKFDEILFCGMILFFQLNNFTLTWSNEEKMKSVRPDITHPKEIQQKMKILDKFIFKNI